MTHVKYKKKKGRREGRGGEVEGTVMGENAGNKKGWGGREGTGRRKGSLVGLQNEQHIEVFQDSLWQQPSHLLNPMPP